MMKVEWQGGRAFEAVPSGGIRFTMDAYPESGGQDRGPTPMEAFLGSLAACSAIDVIAILEKKRQPVRSYRVEIEGLRGPEAVYPRPFTSIAIRHIVEGEGIDPKAVEQAVRLSDEKYCSIAATLRAGPAITSSFEIRSMSALAVS